MKKFDEFLNEGKSWRLDSLALVKYLSEYPAKYRSIVIDGSEQLSDVMDAIKIVSNIESKTKGFKYLKWNVEENENDLYCTLDK